MPPRGEQLVLPGGAEILNPADDEPGGDGLPFFEVNAV
jgi:hypothetical protein